MAGSLDLKKPVLLLDVDSGYIEGPRLHMWHMATGKKEAKPGVQPSKKVVPSAAQRKVHVGVARKRARSEKDVAISTELAPAVAISLLKQADHGKGASAPALEPLAAGAVESNTDGKLRVQLLFENGAILPVEMTEAAAKALGKGIAEELLKN